MHWRVTLKLFVSAPLLLACSHSQAQVLMSAVCSEPVGVRYDLAGEKLQRSDDGFSGVRPQFSLAKGTPPKLTVIWPDSSTRGADAKQNAHEASIVDFTDTMISAIALYENRINLYTLFPLKGLAFMSTHKTIPANGGVPSGAIFKMECKFEFN